LNSHNSQPTSKQGKQENRRTGEQENRRTGKKRPTGRIQEQVFLFLFLFLGDFVLLQRTAAKTKGANGIEKKHSPFYISGVSYLGIIALSLLNETDPVYSFLLYSVTIPRAS
jgi:hypothetical protein